jgi:hypothetical protein
VGLELIVNEVANVAIAQQNNATAISAVPAVWPTLWDIFFPPKAQTPMASISGPEPDLHFIDKHWAKSTSKAIAAAIFAAAIAGAPIRIPMCASCAALHVNVSYAYAYSSSNDVFSLNYP